MLFMKVAAAEDSFEQSVRSFRHTYMVAWQGSEWQNINHKSLPSVSYQRRSAEATGSAKPYMINLHFVSTYKPSL